jgi:hypothetical protein
MGAPFAASAASRGWRPPNKPVLEVQTRAIGQKLLNSGTVRPAHRGRSRQKAQCDLLDACRARTHFCAVFPPIYVTSACAVERHRRCCPRCRQLAQARRCSSPRSTPQHELQHRGKLPACGGGRGGHLFSLFRERHATTDHQCRRDTLPNRRCTHVFQDGCFDVSISRERGISARGRACRRRRARKVSARA